MRNHLPLGSLFGIRIWISRFLLWLVAFLMIVATLKGIHPGFVLLLVVGVAVVVLAHELGHCLVARRHGIRVSHITLWPLGGVAWMEEIPENSKVEGLVAIAGPATTPETGGEGLNLTDREKECLVWLARGLRNDRIAEKMGIKTVTVQLHLDKARKKLAAATREQALSIAIQIGAVKP